MLKKRDSLSPTHVLKRRVGAFLETQMGLDRQATEPHPALRLRKARNCPSRGNFLSLLQQLTAMPRHLRNERNSTLLSPVLPFAASLSKSAYRTHTQKYRKLLHTTQNLCISLIINVLHPCNISLHTTQTLHHTTLFSLLFSPFGDGNKRAATMA